MVVGSDGDEVDIAILWTLDEHFFVKVEIVVVDVLVEGVHVAQIVGVGEGVAESEVNLLVLFPELVVEDAFELSVFSHHKFSFGGYSSPLSLFSYFINWPIAFCVFGLC